MESTIFIGAIIIGGIILLFGLTKIGGQYQRCSTCRDPMPHGYTAYVGGNFYCRSCSTRMRLKPWYWKDCLGDPYKGEVIVTDSLPTYGSTAEEAVKNTNIGHDLYKVIEIEVEQEDYPKDIWKTKLTLQKVKPD